jgi:starch synthase
MTNNQEAEVTQTMNGHEMDVKEGPDAERKDRMSRQGSLSLFRDIDLEDLDAAAHEETAAAQPGYTSTNQDVPVVIVSSEISPWSKSGGLALVTASLAVELAERGHRTMAISPMYDDYKDVNYLGETRIFLMGAEHQVKFFHLWHQVSEGKGVDYIFVDNPCYRRAGGLYYNAQEGVEYADNLYRFALFCLASLEAPCCLSPGGVPYGDRVVFLSNDWQSALLPVYLTHRMRPSGRYTNARCMFVVHNFGYQGIYPCNKLMNFDGNALPSIVKNVDINDFGLDGTGAYSHMIYQYPPHLRSYDGDDGNVWNLTKGAILTCDRLITVSPGYADEMKTAEGGFSLEELVKQKEFFMSGILNGIDVAAWNPRTDTKIACQYDVNSLAAGKAASKAKLQETVGLAQNPNLILVSFVGRLTNQKGLDLIIESLDWMMQDTGNGVTGRIQVFLMGNGDENYVRDINGAADRFRGRVAASKFIPEMEHLLYAGSDFLLMPSRYEPCGLPQMCAQRYGCVPIVTLCGGLKDSVVVEPPEQATGFGIAPLNIHKFKEVTYQACDTFVNRPEEYAAMQKRGFVTDFSWCPRIDDYERNLDWCLSDPPYVR